MTKIGQILGQNSAVWVGYSDGPVWKKADFRGFEKRQKTTFFDISRKTSKIDSPRGLRGSPKIAFLSLRLNLRKIRYANSYVDTWRIGRPKFTFSLNGPPKPTGNTPPPPFSSFLRKTVTFLHQKRPVWAVSSDRPLLDRFKKWLFFVKRSSRHCRSQIHESDMTKMVVVDNNQLYKLLVTVNNYKHIGINFLLKKFSIEKWKSFWIKN